MNDITSVKNIRAITGLDDDELKKSLKMFGWHKEFPAITDENDVLLVGHRRLRLAKQLNIEPVVRKIALGTGDAAGAERLKIALISNIGSQPLTKDDRKRLAEHLYGTREWTMERIAEALNVSQKTVSKDLDGVYTQGINPPRPKGGRPKGRKATKRPEVKAKHEKIVELSDVGLPAKDIAEKVGVGTRMVDRVLEVEAARRDAEPQIDRSMLSMSAQHKLDLAVKQHQRKLDVAFERRVLDDVKKRIDEIVLPSWKKQIAEAQTLYSRRRALMNKETFNIIRRGLHPDSRNAISDKKLGEAFDAFMALEKYLLDEKASPTEFGDLPSSLAEWDKMRVKRNARTTTNSVRPR